MIVIVVIDTSAFAGCRYGAVSGQQGETSAVDAADGYLSVLVFYWNEIGVCALLLVADEKVAAVGVL